MIKSMTFKGKLLLC